MKNLNTAEVTVLNLQDALALAAALCGEEKFTPAANIYRTILAKSPRQFESLLNLGRIRLLQAEPQQARELLQLAVEVNPRIPEAHTELGNAWSAVERHEDAVLCYRQALALRPQDPETLTKLGIALQLLRRHEEAIDAYRQAIALRPQLAAAHNNLGTAFGHVGKLDQAIDSFRVATEIDPTFVNAASNLATALRRLGRHAEALAAYRQWLKLQPDNAGAHDALGLVFQALGRYSEAIEAHKAALAIAPEGAVPYHNLGNALFNLNRHEEAVACYRRTLRLDPDYALAYANMGLTLDQLGRREEALAAFEKSIELAPENVEFHYKMMDAKRFAAGDRQLATLARLDKTVGPERGEDRIKLHFILAKAYDDVGDREGSFEHLRLGNSLMRRTVGFDLGATQRYFEQIQTVFTPALLREKAGRGHPSARPLFVVGMPRSGTTLVEQILASHPRVFAAGELGNLGEAISAATARDGGLPAYPDLVLQAEGRDLFQLGAAYLASLPGPLPPPDRVVDKMPGNFVYAGLIALILPNARVVHLRRNAMDTCFSCYSKLFLAGQPYSYGLEDLGAYYQEYEALMAHWRRVLPPGIMVDVQYEDLVGDFAIQARRLLEHCGLEWDERCLAFHEASRAIRTPSSAQVRRPLYASSIGRWRAYQDELSPLVAALGASAADPPTVGEPSSAGRVRKR